MHPQLLVAALTLAGAASASAASISARAAPTVLLDSATVTGVESGGVAQFLGIPFAKSTANESRLQLPVPVDAYSGTFEATAFGPACVRKESESLPIEVIQRILPQETIEFLVNVLGFNPSGPTSEDCLTINVVKPANVEEGARLPVVAWIYGGSFEVGGTSEYNGTSIVSRSLELQEPVIYVSFNYRLNGFGFLASKEVKEAGIGNLGLQDQRLALKWIQKYVGAFGGDPTKVTIWGESAGAEAVVYHMVANDGNTEGLYRAAFAQSGSVGSYGGLENGQDAYDGIVNKTGCSNASDTLACLRTADFDTLKAAIDEAEFVWTPRFDGALFSDLPQNLILQGKVADVPLITGNCGDEGTLYSISYNISTDAEFKTFLQTRWLPTASDAEIDRLLALYPSDPAQGSPFDTGSDNAITPQYKRSAALLGDLLFQTSRRYLINELSGKQDIYTYIHNRQRRLPVLGSFHASDLVNVYGGGDMADYLIRFVATLDPNGNTGISWPKWTSEAPNMLAFSDDEAVPLSLTEDTYRKEAMAASGEVLFANPS